MNIKKLTYLYVINNKLTELASITKLTKLEKLYAGGNNIQVYNMQYQYDSYIMSHIICVTQYD